MKCEVCSATIDGDRVEFLQETGRPLRCRPHSEETIPLAMMDFSHKTAPSLVVVPRGGEAERLARRAFHRCR